MKTSQERHLNRILRWFNDNYRPKFERGAREHKDLLHEKTIEDLLDMTGEEVLDIVGYFVTLKERTEQLVEENIVLRTALEVYRAQDREIMEGRG
jgi:hypothetical protein